MIQIAHFLSTEVYHFFTFYQPSYHNLNKLLVEHRQLLISNDTMTSESHLYLRLVTESPSKFSKTTYATSSISR